MARTALALHQLVYERTKRLSHKIHASIYSGTVDLSVEIAPASSNYKKVSEAKKLKYKSLKPDEIIAPTNTGEHGEFSWDQRWFRVNIPKATPAQKGKRYMLWRSNGEFTVYHKGVPWCGLDPAHLRCPLPDEGGTMYIDGGMWQTAISCRDLPNPGPVGMRFEYARLTTRNELAWDVHNDLRTLIDWLDYRHNKNGVKSHWGAGYAEPFEAVDAPFRRMMARLTDACDAYDQQGLKALSVELKKIYKEFPKDNFPMTASYVGHAHMDLVWLWPERATYQKTIHTYSTLLRLMEKYPEFIFTMSQPPLMHYLKQEQPEQAKQIEKRIKGGQWEFTGGMEVEADTQIPVGEGLARSIVFGQERIKDVRGEYSNTVWIPDVFGYSQCLPQLFTLGKIKNFYTQKIRWSVLTSFPHHSMVWKSLDGSEVLTHLAVDRYNSNIDAAEAAEGAVNYRNSDVSDEFLLAAGYGDGGGGPTEEHIERARRLKNLNGTPKVGWSKVEDFFDRLNKVRSKLPTYRGELYLEYHRGVQTSQSDFKKYMRACERALQTREAVRVVRGMKALEAKDWLRYLFAHFHDAIPGSSINSVYKEMNPELKEIADTNFALSEKEFGVGKGINELTVFNPLAFGRNTVVKLPKPVAGKVWTGDAIVAQHTSGKEQVVVVSLDSLESAVVKMESGINENDILTATSTRLSNGIVDVKFTAGGEIKAMTVGDQDIELAAPMGFTLAEDKPVVHDAWDIDHSATWMKDNVLRDLKLKVVETGNARAVLEGKGKLGERSTLTLQYILEAGSKTLKLRAKIDWQEKEKLLRFEAPTKYLGETCRFGTPFGSIDRSQREGLLKEEGQWEVPASRWASALNGRGEGLSIISKDKYGFSGRIGVLGMSLLRAPLSPDPVCDIGSHDIEWALTAHSDITYDNLNLSTAALADSLYTDALLTKGASKVTAPYTIEEMGSVVPCWTMPSRDGKGLLIRFHEVAGSSSSVDITFNTKVKKAYLTDLFEDPHKGAGTVKLSGSECTLNIHAYKIATLKVELQ